MPTRMFTRRKSCMIWGEAVQSENQTSSFEFLVLLITSFCWHQLPPTANTSINQRCEPNTSPTYEFVLVALIFCQAAASSMNESDPGSEARSTFIVIVLAVLMASGLCWNRDSMGDASFWKLHKLLDARIKNLGFAFVSSTLYHLLEQPGFLAPGLAIYSDNAYISNRYTVTPFKNVSSGSKDACNFYQSQLRINVECAFGRLVFRLLTLFCLLARFSN